MIGVLLMSHGKMAAGMLDSAKLFFGDNIEAIDAICLEAGDDPELFGDRIREAVNKLDDGHGVVGFCDLMGGTPSNQSIYVMNERFQVIPGMNFPMLLEFLGQRLSVEDLNDVNVNELMEVGKEGIVNLNEKFAKLRASLATSEE